MIHPGRVHSAGAYSILGSITSQQVYEYKDKPVIIQHTVKKIAPKTATFNLMTYNLP